MDAPVSPGQFVLGAGGRFFARGIDTDKAGLCDVLEQAHAFDGAALIEIFQNCIVYNEDVFADFTDRKTAVDQQLYVKHGEPMLFGADGEKGIRFNTGAFTLDVIDAKANPHQVLVHDETNKAIASMLVDLKAPMVLGVIYQDPADSYETSWYAARSNGLKRSSSVADVLRSTNTWTVT